ncbi:hypothetical protein [Butyrivibrio sp. AE3009]|uniref:hypothetical protein n=1 Tax=Butyrivibrio sp. AE3009 TaxID=1280666 RepID=UPI0003B395B0|nr:hypothetical protein [Butyrivibrio sp. AE3009]
MNELKDCNDKDSKQEINDSGSSNNSKLYLFIIGVLSSTTIALTIKNLWTNHQLKKEREKNALYQEAIRKHQAEIDALKNDKEREEYKNRLWEELIRQSEE